MAENLAHIRNAIGDAPVKLIAVTKNVDLVKIEEVFKCGVTEFGENRVQAAIKKQELVGTRLHDIHWHFIGHLQSNKVKQVVGRFALIHSIDSWSLAKAISDEAMKQSLVQSILLQVKVVSDPTKQGFTPEELEKIFPDLLRLPGLDIEGLMTMAPLTGDTAIRQQCFDGLRQLKERLEKSNGGKIKELSMGMSDDFVQAIACGATMIRLGRAVFGLTGNA